MAKGKKMCKYKSFEYIGLLGYLNGRQTIICHNPNLTESEAERIKKDAKYCSRRLCQHYKSR